MVSCMPTSSLRSLNPAELAMVAGGDGEENTVVVTAKRYNDENSGGGSGGGSYYMSIPAWVMSSATTLFGQIFNGDYVVTQDIPPPDDNLEEIVVEASKEQVAAAQAAYAQAGLEISVFQVIGAVIGAAVSKGWGAAAAGANEVADINKESLQNSYADLLYYQDGADGSYDGVRATFGYYGGGWSGTGGGGDIPPTVSPH